MGAQEKEEKDVRELFISICYYTFLFVHILGGSAQTFADSGRC
jgi:hypothetical protein